MWKRSALTVAVWLLATGAAWAQASGGTPVRVTNSGGTDVFHDAVLTASSPNLRGGPLEMSRASTASPTDVSADDKSVMVWCTRKGAVHVNVDNAISAATPTATPCYVVSAATTNSTNCKASAGTLVGFRFTNSTSTNYYVRFYNSATAPNCAVATNFTESILVPNAAGAGGGLDSFFLHRGNRM